MLIHEKTTSPAAAAADIENSPFTRAIRQVKERKVAPQPEPVIPADMPETVECRGLKLCPNDNFLYAVVDGEKIVVRAGKRWAHHLTGKTFEARIVKDGDETTYVYQP